jgi:hypothetical protein
VRGLLRDLVDFDRRALLILAWVPVALTLMEYVFLPRHAEEYLEATRGARPGTPEYVQRFLWWSGGCLATMVVVPSLLLWFGARTSPRQLGLRLRGTGRDAFLYAAIFVVFFPVVWWIALRSGSSDDFQRTYPFFRPRRGMTAAEFVRTKEFLVFEAAYFLQFFAIEYFFRGVMTLGLKPLLGRASILVMLAPYCMIHYHKPMPEAFGAIGAGLVLGSLSWRTGTIVWGWLLHYAVALSMDLLALFRPA